jgi:hypothetical protein
MSFTLAVDGAENPMEVSCAWHGRNADVVDLRRLHATGRRRSFPIPIASGGQPVAVASGSVQPSNRRFASDITPESKV